MKELKKNYGTIGEPWCVYQEPVRCASNVHWFLVSSIALPTPPKKREKNMKKKVNSPQFCERMKS